MLGLFQAAWVVQYRRFEESHGLNPPQDEHWLAPTLVVLMVTVTRAVLCGETLGLYAGLVGGLNLRPAMQAGMAWMVVSGLIIAVALPDYVLRPPSSFLVDILLGAMIAALVCLIRANWLPGAPSV